MAGLRVPIGSWNPRPDIIWTVQPAMQEMTSENGVRITDIYEFYHLGKTPDFFHGFNAFEFPQTLESQSSHKLKEASS
jgi:hypothetical protein